MKAIIITIIGFAVALVIWHFLSKRTDVSSFIPGTYTADWSTEFADVKDTISITYPDNSGTERYYLTRRTSFTYSSKGRKPEYKQVKWTGFYNKENKTLFIQNNGRELSFDPDQKRLVMGVTMYNKL